MISTEFGPADQMDRQSKPNRYYRNAVERHWDPWDIDVAGDLESLRAFADRDGMTAEDFDAMRAGLAKFGAGEEAVTEDPAPLAVVLEDIDEQLFLTTHLSEESKHADFVERYWREVINPFEAERGWERSDRRPSAGSTTPTTSCSTGFGRRCTDR